MNGEQRKARVRAAVGANRRNAYAGGKRQRRPGLYPYRHGR